MVTLILLGIFGFTGNIGRAWAQDVGAEASNQNVVITGHATQENPTTTASSDAAAKEALRRTQETLKNALTVVQERNGVVYLAAPRNTSFANGAKILFVRRRGPRVEPISQGQVIGEEPNPKTKILLIKVQLDRDSITKYPETGDRAVMLADEMLPPDLGPNETHDLPQTSEKKKPDDHPPGYLEFGMGMLMAGSITADSGGVYANSAKKSSGYRFKNIHFAYYSDFFPVGIEMDSHGGDFPTSTYQNTVVDSSESVKMMTFNYRFKNIFGKKLAPRLRVATLSDDFETSAVDGALLSTQTSGLGFGGRLDYEFASPIWKPKGGDPIFTLQALQLELTYFPSITAKDQGLSRGTESSGSTGLYYGAAVTALAWFDFIPVLKRWVVQAGYRVRSYSLKFQGPTVSETGCLNCQIPQNSTSSEKESDLRFFIGVRFDDPIRMMAPKKEEP